VYDERRGFVLQLPIAGPDAAPMRTLVTSQEGAGR
jgi:hypothetical protein